MKYNDLKTKFDTPDIWTYVDNTKQGLPWAKVWRGEQRFQKLKAGLKENIVNSITTPLDAATNEEEIGLLLDPVFEQFSKSYFVNNDINEDLLLKKANKNTLQKKLQAWCAQLNANVPLVKKHGGTSKYKGKLKDVPAIIVCAGPSLKQSIDKLKDLKGKAMIMAVDTSFRSLESRGVSPDFVNAHDANANGARFFQNIKTDAVGLFVNYIHPSTIASYNGSLSFYGVSDPSIPAYSTMALACDNGDGEFLNSMITGGSSVAHTAMYHAIEMGCNPITFVGLDLCYPDLNQSHFESDNKKDVTKEKLIEVTTIRDQKVKTNLSFYSYKTVFDRMAPSMIYMHNIELFTSSEDSEGKVNGVVHAGLRPLPFQDFIERYCKDERKELTEIKEV